MTTITKTMNALKGGEFLIKETDANDIFISEEWNEEQLMIAKTCHDFLAQNVWPNLDRIDAQEEGLMVDLLNKAGELGLLGISVPEEFGGFGKDFITSVNKTLLIFLVVILFGGSLKIFIFVPQLSTEGNVLFP